MKYLNRHIEIAEGLLDEFLRADDEKVLHLYLKRYFSANKKYGKRDRKQISDVVYLIIVRQLLGIDSSIEKLWESREDLNAEKIASQNESQFLRKLRNNVLSDGMSIAHIVQRYLRSSRTFFYTEKKIADPDPLIEWHSDVPSIPVGHSIGHLLGHRNFFVQDISSQKIWEHISLPKGSIWDVCSGGGGKALMCRMLHPENKIYCSDKRKRSLYNLLDRFDDMQVENPDVFVVDMSESKSDLPVEDVGSILADLPCSGSATWHRQPEQALVFETDRLDRYADLQKLISSNAMEFMNSSGLFIYVTCSYFRAENEDVVSLLKEEFNMEVLHQSMVDYYLIGGDALFLAVLRRG